MQLLINCLDYQVVSFQVCYTSLNHIQIKNVAYHTLIFTATEEDHSDDGDDISVNEESGAETTEADNEAQTVESSVDSVRAVSPALVYQEQVHPPPLNGEITPQKSHASHVAASRGLNINVNGAVGDRRRSRMIQGLPVSPRPMNHSPLSTPTSISQPNPSPTQTPR